MPAAGLNPHPRDTTPERSALLSHDLLLGQRLRVHAMARFVVAASIVLGALAGRYLAAIDGLDLSGLTLLAGAIAAYNVVLLRLIGDTGDPSEAVRRFRVRRRLLHASIVLDYIALTVALWFVGGVRSPFVAFYLFHIVIASILLSPRAARVSALLASMMLASLAAVEATGLLPVRTPSGAIPTDAPLDVRYVVTVLAVSTVLFTLAAISQTALAQALRRAERATLRKASELERLSAMRRAFLHVAIHDVGSPIGAITMLLGNLRHGLCGPLTPAQGEQVDRVLQKLGGLESLLRDLRLLGELESADLRGHSVEIRLGGLLAEVVAEQADSAGERGLSLAVEPAPDDPVVVGVPRLVREAIANYLTNAIKFTPAGGTVVARARLSGDVARVEISDTGIGVSQEDQGRLFQEFVRLGERGPAPRAPAGTGLGLSIVRRIVEAHGGRVGVTSAPGEGSTFWLELPLSGGADPPPPVPAGSADP